MIENKFPLLDSSCHFLGHYKNYDLYFCSSECTLIQRYGYKDSEYSSGLVSSLRVLSDFALTNPRDEMRESLIRALLIPQYRKRISVVIEKVYPDRFEIFKERLAEANERLLLESYNDRDLPLLVSSLVYESNKELYAERLNNSTLKGVKQMNDPLIVPFHERISKTAKVLSIETRSLTQTLENAGIEDLCILDIETTTVDDLITILKSEYPEIPMLKVKAAATILKKRINWTH